MDARYATPLANPFALQSDADIEVEQEPLFESATTQISASDWIKDQSPALAFIAGNLLLAAGEYRVYDFAMQNTGEPWKAWFSVMATFIPFMLWEVAVQHAKASGIMRGIAWVGISISLFLGILVGTADFMVVNGQTPNAEALLAALAVSLSVHAILFLAYFYSHPDIKSHRLTAQAIAKQQLAESNAEVAESVLKSARTRLELERRIAEEYGYENLRRAIAEIEGRSYHAPKKSYSPRPTSAQTGSLNLQSAARGSQLENIQPNESSQPLAPLFSNNGHKPEGQGAGFSLSQSTPPLQQGHLHLDDAKPLVAEGIQVQVPAKRGGGKRDTAAKEAYALTLAALGAVSRWTGVQWKNAQDAEGNPLAIAVIPGARFNESKGKTTLDAIHK